MRFHSLEGSHWLAIFAVLVSGRFWCGKELAGRV
jgi:hypothetical protein